MARKSGAIHEKKLPTYFGGHGWSIYKEVCDLRAIREIIVMGIAALGLTLDCVHNEPSHQVVFAPWDLCRIILISIAVAFMGLDEVR